MTEGDNVQLAREVLMIRPARFGWNPDTAASNGFQQPGDSPPAEVMRSARQEFDGLVARLRAAGVGVIVAEDPPEPARPDAVFPNNWVSFHADGTVVLYPLEAASRRAERRADVVELVEHAGFRMTRLIDLSPLEARGMHLEGTGSLVLDHRERIAYAALSSRTHAGAVAEFGRLLDYEPLTFHTADARGRPLYHTNVMLSIGARTAVVCADAIPDAGERHAVVGRLAASGREIVEVSVAQMAGFGANVLELATAGGRAVIAMSQTARRSLQGGQLGRLAAHADIMEAPVPTIERIGGGSVRCMLAEVF